MSKYKNIVIEGNIGAGKTTIAAAFAEHIDARLILESFENNPFLELFYSDKDRYSFQVELFFLAERYHQLSKNLLGDIFREFTVYDYHFNKCAIFSALNLKHGDEHELYKNLFSIMERFMPKPDLLIYLHHDLETLQQQIKKRGRSYEQVIPNEYLQAVGDAYLASFKEIQQFPIVILNLAESIKMEPTEIVEKIKTVVSQDWAVGINRISYDS